MFAGVGVDGLLLDEGRVPAGELIHPEAYRPVLNVADYYDLVLAPVPADADPEAVMTQVRALA
jgi:hypothetical protein